MQQAKGHEYEELIGKYKKYHSMPGMHLSELYHNPLPGRLPCVKLSTKLVGGVNTIVIATTT